MKSLKASLYLTASRRITELSMGPLFDGEPDDDDHASGIIYVCRSHSDHPLILKNKSVVHKMLTGKSIENRLVEQRQTPLFYSLKLN